MSHLAMEGKLAIRKQDGYNVFYKQHGSLLSTSVVLVCMIELKEASIDTWETNRELFLHSVAFSRSFG